MVDTFDFLKGRTVTRANGSAYDRIFGSDAILKGLKGLRFESVEIQRHGNGKSERRRMYTDHFPISATLNVFAASVNPRQNDAPCPGHLQQQSFTNGRAVTVYDATAES